LSIDQHPASGKNCKDEEIGSQQTIAAAGSGCRANAVARMKFRRHVMIVEIDGIVRKVLRVDMPSGSQHMIVPDICF
jgi:hypothetical protein